MSVFDSRNQLYFRILRSYLYDMRYDKVVKLYKNYSLTTGTKRYLVGYFRNNGSASAEESYLRRAEKEPVPVSFTTEVEPATLYPDIVKRWEDEDAEAARQREERERLLTTPIPLPRVRKRWPSFRPKTVDECFDEWNEKQKTVIDFVRTLDFKRKKSR